MNVDSILFKSEFNPAFVEPCLINIEGYDTLKRASIIIFVNPRNFAGKEEFKKNTDTLYSKTVAFSENQIKQLESDCFTKLNTRISSDSSSGFDGILKSLRYKGNTTLYSFWSPDSHRNPDAAAITIKFLENTRNIFDDSIISGYCDDLQFYLDYIKENEVRPIDRLRRIAFDKEW